jgi:hypothetical protein
MTFVIRRSRTRFVLGMLQIAGVGLSLGLIIAGGINPLSVAAVVVTTAIALVSVLLRPR